MKKGVSFLAFNLFCMFSHTFQFTKRERESERHGGMRNKRGGGLTLATFLFQTTSYGCVMKTK